MSSVSLANGSITCCDVPFCREELQGSCSILRYLARCAPEGSELRLYGISALEAVQVRFAAQTGCVPATCSCWMVATAYQGATQVDQWLVFSSSIVSGSGLQAVCDVLNTILSLRTYLVGYALSIADLQVWGQLQGKQTHAVKPLFLAGG